MKRFCAGMLMICLSLSIYSVSIVAMETEDSIRISSDEMQVVQNTSQDIIVKLYGGYFMDDFNEEKRIGDIINNDDLHILYMIIGRRGHISYKHNYHGEIVKISSSMLRSDWTDFHQYAISTGMVFDNSFEVNQVYCLNGEPSHDGVYIYYSTNKGDYVLFKEYLDSDEEYLFPLEDFYRFAKVVYEDRYLNRYKDGGGRPVNELFDMNQYTFHPRYRNIWIVYVGIALVAVAAVGVFTYLMIQRKKKNHSAKAGGASQ